MSNMNSLWRMMHTALISWEKMWNKKSIKYINWTNHCISQKGKKEIFFLTTLPSMHFFRIQIWTYILVYWNSVTHQPNRWKVCMRKTHLHKSAVSTELRRQINQSSKFIVKSNNDKLYILTPQIIAVKRYVGWLRMYSILGKQLH